MDLLGGLLRHLLRAWPVDRDRVVVTGISMGGYATWRLAARSPRRLAAIVPICGGGDPESARTMRHLPVWAFHGALDESVPLSETAAMVEALRSLGAPVRFTVLAGKGHDVWTETYQDPVLYDWMRRQRRRTPR